MNILKATVLYVLFAIVITYSWRWYEIKAFGSVQEDPFDSVIAVILSLSLVVNVFLIHHFVTDK